MTIGNRWHDRQLSEGMTVWVSILTQKMHDCLFFSWLVSSGTADLTALVKGSVSTTMSEDQDISIKPEIQKIKIKRDGPAHPSNKKQQDIGDSMTIGNRWHDRQLSEGMTLWVPISILKMHDCLFVGWLDNLETAGMTVGIRDGGSAHNSTRQDVVNERITALENITQHEFRISNYQE